MWTTKKSGNGRTKKLALASKDPTSIGNLLVRMGVITEDQLLRAISIQHDAQEQLLGDILVKVGFVGRDYLDLIVEQQSIMRKRGDERSQAVLAKTSHATERTNSVLSSLEHISQLTLTPGKAK